MRFDIYDIIFNPFFLIFITMILGLWVGYWKKLGKMKLGVGGPLFVGLIIGWAVVHFAHNIGQEHSAYTAVESLISQSIIPSNIQFFLLVLFVAAIGLLASKDMRTVIKKYGTKLIMLGIVITFLGAALSYTAVLIKPDSNVYETSGLYTGALTSSPGLGAALEASSRQIEDSYTGDVESLATEAASEISTGYVVAYPFGMIAVILAMILIPKIFKIDLTAEKNEYRNEIEKQEKIVKKIDPVRFDLKAYALVCVIGYILGTIEINLGIFGYFGLGSIGGILIISIVFGYIGKIGPFTFRMDGKILGTIRDLALASYIGSIGLKYGYQVVESLIGSGLYLAVASIVIAGACIMIGFLVGRYVMGLNWVILSGAICGGMTSTPGLGMAVDSIGSDDPATGYAAAYPFALICMVLFTIIMYNIPGM